MFGNRHFILFIDMDGVFNSAQQNQKVLEHIKVHGTVKGVEDYRQCPESQNWVQPSIVERFVRFMHDYPEIDLICISAWAHNQARCMKDFQHTTGLTLLAAYSGGSDREAVCEDFARDIPYLAIDDDASCYSENCENLIHVDGKVGLTEDDLIKIRSEIEARLKRC